MTAETMLFGPLVGLVVAGPDLPVDGVVHHVSEDGERFERIRRDGFRVRVESIDGEVRYIATAAERWFFQREDGRPLEVVHSTLDPRMHRRGPLGGMDVGGPRGSFERWDGNDFTRPTGPVEATTFLGREAWTVELAPPGHKPYPLRITVDAETGMILRSWNDGFGTGEQWSEVTFGADLADELFSWTGPTTSQETLRAARDAEHERDMADRAEWLASRGFADLPLLARGTLQLHHWEDDGSLYASVNFDHFGTLIRRPRSQQPWDEPGTANSAHKYQWADETWDWCYTSAGPMTAAELAELKTALGRTR